MKILAILLTVLAAIISIGGLVEPEHSFRIVSKYYNFSAGFPAVPTVSTVIFQKLILDRYCLIDAGARADKNVGATSLFMQSVSSQLG